MKKIMLISFILIGIMLPSSFAISNTTVMNNRPNSISIIFQKASFFIANTYQNIDLMLTFNPTVKIEKQLQYAQNRGKEAQVWAAMGQTRASMRALNNERGMMQAALNRAKHLQKMKNIENIMKAINQSKMNMIKQKNMLMNIFGNMSNMNQSDISMLQSHFNNMSSIVKNTEMNLTNMKINRMNEINNELTKISDITGLNINDIYNNIQENGDINNNEINNIITLVNSKYSNNLKSMNNKTIALTMMKNNSLTQIIYLKINNNKIVLTNENNNADIKLSITPQDITQLVVKIQHGNNMGIMEEFIGMSNKGSIISNTGNIIHSLIGQKSYINKNPVHLQSVLYQLKQSTQPIKFATQHGLYVKNGKVRVVIELVTKTETLPTGYGIVEETRYDGLVQAMVPINNLIKISEIQGVKVVRIPNKAIEDIN